MVHIIGEILGYIEQLVADFTRESQGGGSYNGLLSEARGPDRLSTHELSWHINCF